MKESRNGAHALYRFFDAAGDLLYIGLTVNLPTRLLDHRDGKPWWYDVATMTVQWLPDREQVIQAERLAIINERPRYNVQHNLGRRATTGMPAPKVSEYRFDNFDHSQIVELPEYGQLRLAMNELALRSGILSDDEWLQVTSDIVATTPHADNCRRCRVMNWPYRIEESQDGTGFRGWYRCVRCADIYGVMYYAYEQAQR